MRRLPLLAFLALLLNGLPLRSQEINVAKPPPRPFTPVAEVMDAQNRVAALEHLRRLNFYFPPGVVEEYLQKESDAVDNVGGLAGGEYDFTRVGDMIENMKQVEKEKGGEALKIASKAVNWAVKKGADANDVARWFESVRAEADKKTGLRGLNGLAVARGLLELEKTKPTLDLYRSLTSVAVVYGGSQGQADPIKKANTLVKYLIAVEKERECIRKRLELAKFLKDAVKIGGYIEDPVGKIGEKVNEYIRDAAVERGFDKETYEAVSKVLQTAAKSAVETVDKCRSIGQNTDINIPESVRKTARGFAVAAGVYAVLKEAAGAAGGDKAGHDPETGAAAISFDPVAPIFSVLDFYVAAFDLPWQFAEKLGPMMNRGGGDYKGLTGKPVLHKMAVEEGIDALIEIDKDAAEYGVVLGIGPNEGGKPKGFYLAISDTDYVAIDETERRRLLRAVCDERIVNAWYDASEYFWSRWIRQAGQHLNYSNWVEYMQDGSTFSDKDRKQIEEAIPKVARATGVTGRYLENLAKDRYADIKVNGKQKQINPEELREAAEKLLLDLGETEFIRGALADVTPAGRNAYGWFRHGISSAGLVFSRSELQKMFTAYVTSGCDMKRMLDILQKTKQDRIYAGLAFGVPRVSVGEKDEAKRGGSVPVEASVSVDGLPPGFEAPAKITWETPDWAGKIPAQEIRISNGVKLFTAALRVPADVPLKENRIAVKVEVPLPREKKAEAWGECFFDVIDAPPSPPTGLQMRPAQGFPQVEFHSDAVKGLQPRDWLTFRLYRATSKEGPWLRANDREEGNLSGGAKLNDGYGQVLRTGDDTAAIKDNWRRDEDTRPYWYKVAQILRKPDGKETETVSEPLAPAKPEVVIKCGNAEMKGNEGTINPDFRLEEMSLELNLVQPGQNFLLPGVHFTVETGGHAWHAWSGRKEGDLYCGGGSFVGRAGCRVPLYHGVNTLTVRAEDPGGLTATGTAKITYDPKDEADRAAQANAPIEEDPWVKEMMQQAAGASARVKAAQEALPGIEERYKDHHGIDYQVDKVRCLNEIAYGSSRVQELVELARAFALKTLSGCCVRDGQFDRALSLYKEHLQKLPACQRQERAWEERAWSIFLSVPPLYEGQQKDHDNKMKALETKHAEALVEAMQGLPEAAWLGGDYETYRTARLELMAATERNDPKANLREDYDRLAEAAAAMAGDRQAAAAFWLRSQREWARQYDHPDDKLKEALDRRERPDWWPEEKGGDKSEGKKEIKPAEIPSPAELNALHEKMLKSADAPSDASAPAGPRPNPPPSSADRGAAPADSGATPPSPAVSPAPAPSPAAAPPTVRPGPPPVTPPPPAPSEPGGRVEGPNPAAAAQSLQEGDAAYQKGDVDAALGAYTRAIELDPANYRARVSRGFTGSVVGRYAEAIGDYRAALALAPGAGDQPPDAVRYYLADCLILQGQMAEADAAVRGIEANPSSAAAGGFLRAEYHMRLGDRAGASAALGRALQADPNLANNQYQMVFNYLRFTQYGRALLTLDLIEIASPQIAGIHYARGWAYAGLRQKENALAAYRRYLELDPSSEWAQNARKAIMDLENAK